MELNYISCSTDFNYKEVQMTPCDTIQLHIVSERCIGQKGKFHTF